MTEIVFDRVRKAYAEKQVLSDFSARAQTGECVLFKGPSGCGKTTMLRMAAGLETPDSGIVSRPEGTLSYVFQEDRLIEHLSALKNLLLVCITRQQREDAAGLLAGLGLSAEDRTPVSAYSGGMRQRVAIARALVVAPQILLLDEPFTGLDDGNRRIAAEMLREGKSDRITLLVSHDVEDGALMRVDRTVAMR